MKRSSYLLGLIALVSGFVVSVRVTGEGAQAETPRQASAITGRVLLPDGSPASGVRIVAITEPSAVAQTDQRQDERDQSEGIPNDSKLISLSRTDEAGQYQLEGIPPGRYFVVAGGLEEPIFYPGVKARADATVISVLAGTTIEHQDFNLSAPLTLKVGGRVVRDGHQGGTTVLLSAAPSSGWSAAIAPDGSFEFPQVPPGTYRLRIAPNLTAPAPVTVVVGANDVTGLEIPIPRTAISTVPVKFELAAPKGAALPRLKLTFVPLPTALQPSATIAISNPVHEQAMAIGLYRLSGLKDIQLPTGYFIRSIMAGSTDLMKTRFEVTRSGVPPVIITFGVSSPPWVQVNGRVTGMDNASVRARRVLVSLPGFITPLTAAVNADGSFVLPFVLPGRHRVDLEPAADPFSRVILVGDTGLADARIPMSVSAMKVSGRIKGIPSTPSPARILTWLHPEPVTTGLQSFSAVVGQDGTFTFNGVPPGRYQLSVACEEARGFRSSRTCPAITVSRARVTVADKDVSNLMLGEDILAQIK